MITEQAWSGQYFDKSYDTTYFVAKKAKKIDVDQVRWLTRSDGSIAADKL